MQTEYLVAVEEVCTSHNIDISFINSLHQNGLIELTIIKETRFIASDQLQQLEKFIRLYYELNINIEGIETIAHMLERIIIMQNEIAELKNRLRLYENA